MRLVVPGVVVAVVLLAGCGSSVSASTQSPQPSRSATLASSRWFPQKCSPLAKVLADVPAKPISQISKPEDIAAFVAGYNTYVAANGGPPNIIRVQPELVVLFPRPDHAILYVTFNNGCARTMGSFALEAIDTIITPPADKPTPTPPTKEQKNFTAIPGPKVGHPMSPDDGRI